MKKVVIVGNPNVGKSVLFNKLTGRYVVVSNYPGTTVEIQKGKMVLGGEEYQVMDTPGMYSCIPINEEERVARSILIRERPDLVIHVVEAKCLERMLPLTLDLIEAGLPVLLALNMMDEAKKAGLTIDREILTQELGGVPVVGLVATKGEGIQELKETIAGYHRQGVCCED